MTNFENSCEALIKSEMYVRACKDAIANVINIIQCPHILTVLWSICYDQLKPLKLIAEGKIGRAHV